MAEDIGNEIGALCGSVEQIDEDAEPKAGKADGEARKIDEVLAQGKGRYGKGLWPVGQEWPRLPCSLVDKKGLWPLEFLCNSTIITVRA